MISQSEAAPDQTAAAETLGHSPAGTSVSHLSH